jgi:ABC-type branched-subunit amino acid transport system ATPase component
MQAGHVRLRGIDVTRLPRNRRARYGLARTFQHVAVVDTLTVRESMVVAQTGGAYWRSGLGRPALKEQALAAVDQCALTALLDVKLESLSFLDRRLVALAMALAIRPDVVLLDEATAGLTLAERARIGATIRNLATRWNTAFVVIEHDVEFVAHLVDHLVVMNHGALLFEGSPADVLKDPAVIESYLGSPNAAVS